MKCPCWRVYIFLHVLLKYLKICSLLSSKTSAKQQTSHLSGWGQHLLAFSLEHDLILNTFLYAFLLVDRLVKPLNIWALITNLNFSVSYFPLPYPRHVHYHTQSCMLACCSLLPVIVAYESISQCSHQSNPDVLHNLSSLQQEMLAY